ncbi:MAG: CoA-binding protein [candidate division NC10 bacterium]|nr:CoA-binding protein [candidate division NC10 bacterium]
MTDPDNLSAIFTPKSVAVIGTSTSPEKLGFQILKNIVDAGFKGPIYPVNPKATAILDLPCYPSIGAVEGAPELAVIIVPATAVPATLADCGAKGVRGAIVISGGFSESGPEGEALQRQAVEVARTHKIRMVGPNCQGVNNPYHGLCASWPLLTMRGAIAVVSQSGTVAAALMDWAAQEGIGVSGLVSMGNRGDVDEADLIEHFDGDPRTQAIAVYIEGVKNGPRFLAAARRARKPIVVLKPGRTEKGRQAAESHTKSLAGRDEVYQGAFRQFGICRAETLHELYDFSKALAYLRRPTGRRLLIVTSSGGCGVLAADIAAAEGLDVAPLPEAVSSQLRASLPRHFVVNNPLDLTGDANSGLYKDVLAAAKGAFDVAAVIFGDPIVGTSELIDRDHPELVIYLGGADVEREEARLLHARGVPVFPTPERGMRALAQLVRFGRPVEKARP